METEEFKKSFKARYKSTSSFFCGITLMGLDAFVLLLCIGTGFFIVNAINNSWINFRSFVIWIREGDVVLVKPWDFQSDQKADVIWRYTRTESNWLERKGYLTM